MIIVHIKGNVQWKAFRDPDSKYWVAVCDALKLTTQGETWSELLESINDSLNLLLRELLNTGDFNRFLKEHGWKMEGEIPPRHTELRFDVPFRIDQMRRRYDTEVFTLAPARCRIQARFCRSAFKSISAQQRQETLMPIKFP